MDAGFAFSITALVISLVSALFTVVQVLASRRSALASERSAAAAEQSAATAGCGLQISQRAYVVLDRIDRNKYFDEVPCEITYQLVNKGASPALDLATRHRFTLSSERTLALDHSNGVDQYYGVLAHDSHDPLCYTIRFTFEQASALKNETLHLYISGIAKYKDMFDQSHETEWLLRYDCPSGFFSTVVDRVN